MKVATIGWEADMLKTQGGSKPHGVQVITPVLNPIIVRGYELSVSFMPWNDGGMFSPGYAEVLFAAWFDGPPLPNDFGPSVLKDLSPVAQNLHGLGPVTSRGLCNGILKGFIGINDTVNEIFEMSGLSIEVAAGSNLWMTADQSGAGPLDFEVQGNIYYETQP